MDLPEAFCWTKFGVEAGESQLAILERKELERASDGGVFLWGIGNSIRPSLIALLAASSMPEVVFTPMLSVPLIVDAQPDQVVRWTRARGLDGDPFVMPDHSRVTSRQRPGKRSHYALVCSSETRIGVPADAPRFASEQVCNLQTGNPVGASQVTSVVKRLSAAAPAQRRRYLIAFRAMLVRPYFVELTSPRAVPVSA